MNLHRRIGSLLIGSALGAMGPVQPSLAQVVPDQTLPVGERSQVSGNLDFQIDGGAKREGNLFHSFDQLSVPTGGSVFFNNAADVQNIFSRVTGGSASTIDGLVRANGTANLFLLNPNGILFGPNGLLNIGGSFVATTANSISFADGFQYSAANPQTTPLLTISAPIGLQMGTNSGQIGVQGNGYDLSVLVPIFTPLIRGNSTAGLQVPTGQTLALVGGDIAIDGGTLTAEQGHIELGSVRDGLVALSATSAGFAFDYSASQRFGDIRLSQQALADASGGGLIQVQGSQVSLADGSLLLIQNQGTQAGGSINVDAARSLELSGTGPDGAFLGGLISQTEGIGRGADLTVSTQQLLVRDAAGIQTDSHGFGKSGSVTVQASDSVQVIGFSAINPSLNSSLGTGTYSSGDAGDVTVSTQELSVLDGGTIGVGTFGIGRGGNVTVNALDFIKVVGQSALPSASNLVAVAVAGDAGRLTVNTSRLILQDGGIIATSTLGTGNAGSVIINASNFIEISGGVFGSPAFSSVSSSASIVPESLRQAYRLPDRPSGNSGNLTINTPRLSISDGANVSVSNDGTGSAGTVRVNANSIVVSHSSSITAATAFGEGGNLDLNVRDLLLLRNNSQITTSAGDNGGNVRISAGLIAAIPAENSDIRANSANARGGNVTIDTSGIFGLQFRSQETPLSDITATGANSASSGTVQVNINQPDSTFGLVDLPTNLVDSSRLIAQGCLASQGNSFVASGRGGLPPTPAQQLDDDAGWQDRRRLSAEAQPDTTQMTDSQGRSPRSNSSLNPPLIEATGWQITPTGAIRLVAASANSALLNQSAACQGSQ